MGVGRQHFDTFAPKREFDGIHLPFQEIVLNKWCANNHITVIHEIFHALGLFHFHSAENSNLKIIEENIREGPVQSVPRKLS